MVSETHLKSDAKKVSASKLDSPNSFVFSFPTWIIFFPPKPVSEDLTFEGDNVCSNRSATDSPAVQYSLFFWKWCTNFSNHLHLNISGRTLKDVWIGCQFQQFLPILLYVNPLCFLLCYSWSHFDWGQEGSLQDCSKKGKIGGNRQTFRILSK